MGRTDGHIISRRFRSPDVADATRSKPSVPARHGRGKLEMKKDRRGINPASKPSGDGCVECLASPDGWWFHLRRCAKCGHIGCCDSSPRQHASKHAATTGHPIIASFKPCEDWFYDYEKRRHDEGIGSSCFRHIPIRRINHHLDRQREFQPIGNRCCTSWPRSIVYEWERDSEHRICSGSTVLERSHP